MSKKWRGRSKVLCSTRRRNGWRAGGFLVESGDVFRGEIFTEDVIIAGPLDDVEFLGCVFVGAGLKVNGGPSNEPVGGLVLDGCRFTDSPHHAVFLNWSAPDARITNNRIVNPAMNGVWVGNGSNDAAITGNRVTRAGRMGIEVWDAEGCTISGNRIKDVVNAGISCDRNYDGAVVGNIITDVGGSGIENAGSKPLTVTGNTVTRATQRPVTASQPGQVTVVVGNTFTDCGWGLQIYQADPGTAIVGNYFNNVGSGDGANGRTVFINESPDTLVEANTLINGEAHTAIFGVPAGGNLIVGY